MINDSGKRAEFIQLNGSYRPLAPQSPSAAGAVLHRIEKDFEHTADFLPNLVGADGFLVGSLHCLVCQITDGCRIIREGVRQMLSHLFFEEVDVALAHEG